MKAAFGFEMSPDDIEWTDPELYQQKVRYLQGCNNEELADLELTFIDTIDTAMGTDRNDLLPGALVNRHITTQPVTFTCELR